MGERDAKGRFQAGNSGKPKGARHRATRAVMDLLEGEAEDLTRKAIDAAIGGDSTAMRLCLERIAPPPRDSAVKFRLPKIHNATDALTAAASIVEAVAAGKLTPTQGAHVMGLVESYRRTIETSELEQRVAKLEEGEQ